MKPIKAVAVLVCGLMLIAATRGTEVTAAQVAQFQPGVAMLPDVEGKLGPPQHSHPTEAGGTADDYVLMQESANGAAYVPLVRLAAGAMNLHETRVEFRFDDHGRLADVTTSQRDLVCPHHVCTDAQLNQPWTPLATQGD